MYKICQERTKLATLTSEKIVEQRIETEMHMVYESYLKSFTFYICTETTLPWRYLKCEPVNETKMRQGAT